MNPNRSNSILYLSTYPPRECGIATFTKDLTEAVQRKYNPALKPKILAINSDITDIFAYDRRVVQQMYAGNIEDYIALAQELNETPEVKLVHIQHEFGIFGGSWGDYLIPFFQTIRKPVIITFHTVLPKPDRTLLRVVKFMLQHCQAAIVMNEFSRQILKKEYGASEERVAVIPHGIPYVPSPNGHQEKQRIGLEHHLVLSTFGLLGPGKGIEYALRALHPVVKRYPNLLYLIIGITHPVIRKTAGETYRNFLRYEVKRLGLSSHVRFYNKYLAEEEITGLLRSTDIYLSPSIDRNQSSSGTLSYALGCGTPVICTDSLYARSLVTPEIGVLVKPKRPEAITKALLELCRDPQRMAEMGKTAFAQTRHMTWPNVALGHFNLYQKFVRLEDEQKVPEFSLRHLKKLTDDFGIIQFAKHTKPDLHYGYATDDNARALIVVTQTLTHLEENDRAEVLELAERYLKFISRMQRPSGTFANLVSGKRKIIRQQPSEDAQGRTLWALGYLMNQTAAPHEMRKEAERMFRKATPTIHELTSPRAIAFAILGLFWYTKARQSSHHIRLLRELADKQVAHYLQAARENWLWFEEALTYSNSKLPESLFFAYLATKKKSYLKIAEKALGFLIDITFEKGYFAPIGQNGWYLRSGKRAYFDQQPEDASSMVQTLAIAWRTTEKATYRKLAHDTFQWFLGKNHLNQMVYDEVTGGCYDGLGQHTINLNQGAESTISYLLARLAIEEL